MRRQNFEILVGLLFLFFLSGCSTAEVGKPIIVAFTPTATPAPGYALPIKGSAIVMRGGYVYLAVGGKVQAIDVSAPSSPKLASEVRIETQIDQMVLLGSKLFTFDRRFAAPSRYSSQLISVLNVSSPASIQPASGYRMNDLDDPTIYDATLLGNKAYIMLGSRTSPSEFAQGLFVVDGVMTNQLKQVAYETNFSLGQITA